ncbi:MAG: RNA methyltransferase [Prevotella sp.]|nr:RNA methyltransferase [Prevotella sp.]
MDINTIKDMEIQHISSLQNQKIKNLVLLQQKSAERRKQNCFVVEGQREIQHCLSAGFCIESVFFLPQLVNIDFSQLPTEYCYSVSQNVYEKIAYRGSTEGIIAIVRSKNMSLHDIKLSEKPLVMVAESVEKPGNIGAILRSADAAHADAVILCDGLTDIYNPNIIRSSIGAVFTVPVVSCSSAECIEFLKQRNIRILTAQLQDSKPYYDCDMTQPTAIVMGTESTGLTNQWRESADAHILIPMLGKLDSLNVSVSAAIFLFEAVRQRQR